MTCHILDPQQAPWKRLEDFPDRTVFQTQAWVNFVANAKRATPVIAELREGSDVAGYFTGLTFWKFGIKILGSSFPGWTTPYMGFNLLDGVERWRALEAVERLAFGPLHCLHMEVSDPYLTQDDGLRLGFEAGAYQSYETDLRQSEDEIFAKMSSACRRCIRKAEKEGLRVEEAHDIEFADEYYRQLEDVFAKQSLTPTYDVKRVRLLVQNLLPTGNLLLLRACLPDG
ncbi:MAG: lipid II:glycine glycyltransferase FemX, partial [Candidatus Acidiferrales bacterium]